MQLELSLLSRANWTPVALLTAISSLGGVVDGISMRDGGLKVVRMEGLKVVPAPWWHRLPVNTWAGVLCCKGNHALVVMLPMAIVLATVKYTTRCRTTVIARKPIPWQVQAVLAVVNATATCPKEITSDAHRGVGVGRPYGAGTRVHREGPFVGIQAGLELAEAGGEAFIEFALELLLHREKKEQLESNF